MQLRVLGAEDGAILASLAQVEGAADRLIPGLVEAGRWPPTPGAERFAHPGFIVAALEGGVTLGFAHVLDLEGHHHLEQVSVRPEHGRQGIGRALIYAACTQAQARGASEITLITFAGLPWNAPFYRRFGFRDAIEVAGPVQDLREREIDSGLDELGRRIVMTLPLATRVSDPVPAVSVIPMRDGPDGIEIFVQHRASTMDFAADVAVFPGGRSDPGDEMRGADLDLAPEVLDTHLRAWAEVLAGREVADPRAHVRALIATGLRELAEETLLTIAADRLVPWDCWVTPPICPLRFDVSFFLLPLSPDEPQPVHSTTEANHSGWAHAARLFADSTTGAVGMLTPTRELVRELAALGTVAAATSLRPRIVATRDDLPGARPRPPGR